MLARRGDIQELAVEVEGGEGRALNYVSLAGEVGPGDRVRLNTAAVALGLGSGGYHFVMSVEGRLPADTPLAGHLMKLRYTPWQFPVRAVEEDLAGVPPDLGGLPVIVGEVHSQLAPALLGAAAVAPPPRVVYVMTDGGALPLALSRQVTRLKAEGLIAATITAGHAFGGDFEAVTVPGALLAARLLAGAELAVVCMGPGIAGTGSALGFSGVEQASVLDAAAALGGRPIAVARLSFADPRPRHRGLSHHTRTNLGLLVRSRVALPIPILEPEGRRLLETQLQESGIAGRHDVIEVDSAPLEAALAASALPLETMGRRFPEDREFFLAAAAAGRFGAARGA